MNKVWIRGLPLVFLFVLAACGGRDGGLYSRALEGQLAPMCSQPPPEPPVNPSAFWEGTLTTTTGGSGTEPFTAEITRISAAYYEGIFRVGEKTCNVTGSYNGTGDEGSVFAFSIPLEELGPTVSPGIFPGLTWSGSLTESTYSGGWFREEEDGTRSQTGKFALERRP